MLDGRPKRLQSMALDDQDVEALRNEITGL